MKNEEKLKVPFKDMWGFRLDNYLFRIDTVDHFQPVYVQLIGKKIVLYGSGDEKFFKIREGITNDDPHRYEPGRGYKYYFSEKINGEMIPVVIPSGAYGGQRKRFRAFAETHPQYNSIYECMNDKDWKYVPECVYKFEGVNKDYKTPLILH